MNALEPETIEKLREALGADAVECHDPLSIEGAELGITLRPADGKALALALGALSRSGLSALVRGGGTGLGLGNPLDAPSVILSCERLVGVDEFDASDGVCHVLAGTSVADAREVVRRGGWELPLDALDARSSVGGVLASAGIGPRALGFGSPRDVVLGLEIAVVSGDRIRSGGRVVKNVTGYDLNKVFVGSLGSLGVIEAAWLRLEPLPEAVRVLEASLSDVGGACAFALEAARRATARAAALVSPTDAGFRLVLEFAGDAPSVASDAAWFEAHSDSVVSSEAAIEALRVLQAGPASSDRLGFRLSILATRLPSVLESLRTAGAHLLAYPGLGLVFAGFTLGGTDTRAAADAAWARVAAAAQEGRGEFRLESGPLWFKTGRDAFVCEGPALLLIQRLKERFDPRRVLNPGRFAGRI